MRTKVLIPNLPRPLVVFSINIFGGNVKRIFAALLTLAFVSASSLGVGAVEKYSGGALPTGGILTKANSPYYITQPIVVLPGETLTIEPGVEILANPAAVAGVRYLVDLRGSLNISGSIDQPIVIIGVGNGIRLSDSYNLKTDTPVSLRVAHTKLERMNLDINKRGQYVIEDSSFESSDSMRVTPYGVGRYINDKYECQFANVSMQRNAFHNAPLYFQVQLCANLTFQDNYLYSQGLGISLTKFRPVNEIEPESVYKRNTFNFVGTSGVVRVASSGINEIDLTGNYWKGTPEGMIPSIVDDGNDRRGTAILVVSPILMEPSINAPKSTSREALEKKALTKFKKCSDLKKFFPNGVTSIAGASLTGTSIRQIPFSSVKGYAANKALDKDKDKIACEN